MRAKIIIIGAGIAGLAAANELRKNHFDVTILEAGERLGGRIWTDNSMGLPVARGASWIHGMENNPITSLAAEFNARIFPMDFSRFGIFDREGQLIPPEVYQAFNEKMEDILKRAKDFAEKSATDCSLAFAISQFLNPAELSPLEQDFFKRKLAFFEGYIGDSYQHLSARYWDTEEELPGNHGIVIDSYQPIIDGLARDCPIHFNTTVKEIHELPQGMEVVTENNHFQADAVLVTVSLGVLKKKAITFNPPLPDRKQKAIARMEMGVFNIAALKFPYRFWSDDLAVMLFAPFDSASFSSFVNYDALLGQPILIAYAGGERARLLEQQPEDQLVKNTLANLNKLFKKPIPEPESYFFTRWSQDPLFYGSYSYLPVGAQPSDRAELAEPASSRLFFAGEASNVKFPASTHGAYWSGLREAERIERLYP